MLTISIERNGPRIKAQEKSAAMASRKGQGGELNDKDLAHDPVHRGSKDHKETFRKSKNQGISEPWAEGGSLNQSPG